MKTYQFTIAANVRAYATVTINAEDEAAADKRAEEIAATMNDDARAEPPEMDGVVFNTHYDSMSDFEYLEDADEVEVEF